MSATPVLKGREKTPKPCFQVKAEPFGVLSAGKSMSGESGRVCLHPAFLERLGYSSQLSWATGGLSAWDVGDQGCVSILVGCVDGCGVLHQHPHDFPVPELGSQQQCRLPVVGVLIVVGVVVVLLVRRIFTFRDRRCGLLVSACSPCLFKGCLVLSCARDRFTVC
jgi:hypothetical protein